MLIPIAIWIVTVTLSILFIRGATRKPTPKPTSKGSDHVATKAERMQIARMELDNLILQLTLSPTDEQLAAKAQLSAKWVN